MAMMRSMVPLAELGGEGEDLRGDLAQATVLLFQAVQLLPLCSGRTFVPPARSCSAKISTNSSCSPCTRSTRSMVISSRTCGRARASVSVWMWSAVSFRASVDHAGDERHLADRLPVHAFGRGHTGSPLIRP